MSIKIHESVHFLRTARDRLDATLRETWSAARERFAPTAGNIPDIDESAPPARSARRPHTSRPRHVTRRMSRVQKAGALVPMGILVSGWAVAVGNTGLANATADGESVIPQVPATPLDQPAIARSTVGGLDPQAGISGAMATLSTNGIPSAALYAYKHAEMVLADADPSCRLPWHLVAAIGRVESNHGRSNGNILSADGIAQPGITAPALGPMQLAQATFDQVAIDSDGDGTKNPQDIDDAATAAGIFLCSGEGDLATDAGARSAVARYGDGNKYVKSVLRISASYANGLFSQTPDGFSTSTILTSRAYDQTLTAEERDSAKRDEEETVKRRERIARERRNRAVGGTTENGSSPEGGSESEGGGEGGGEGEGGGNALNETLSDTGDAVEETLKRTTDTVNETLNKTNETLKKTTDGVKKLLGQ